MNYLLPLFILLTIFSHAQTWVNVTEEYIQNPSFEEYTACPQGNSVYPNGMWIDSVVGWYAPTQATSDYFNACNSTNNDIPVNNTVGYQQTFDGTGYCGFLSYALDISLNQMWSEYIQTELLQSLKAKTRYRFSMRINRANGYNLAVQNIGANFTGSAITNFSGTNPYNLNPTILNSTGFITDTLDWTLVSGEFTATGNENYLTIGWFGDTITSDFLFFIPPDIDPTNGDSLYLTETYYLVDSLTLSELVWDIENFDANILTPNNDNVNDVFNFSKYELKQLKFEVYNRWGVNVFSSNDNNLIWNGTHHSGEKLSSGTYYYVITSIHESGQEFKKSNHFTIFY